MRYYGHKENSTDYARYKIYTLERGCLESKPIPLYLDSLNLHISRADYKAYILKKLLTITSLSTPTILLWLEPKWGRRHLYQTEHSTSYTRRNTRADILYMQKEMYRWFVPFY